MSRLARDDLALVEPRLERVTLALRADMEKPNQPIEHVYFPESGLGSVVAVNANHERLEVGIFGREGMSGSTVVMGDSQSPHETFVQIPGAAMRIAVDDLRKAMRQSPTLHSLLVRYVQTFMIQSQHTALANGRAKLEERLARWLIMAHDRVAGDELPLTHEFLALMLGVRRTGVTLALHILEGRGLILSRRSLVQIVDRDGLLETSAGSYGVPESEYERLLGEHAAI